ncbi:MAG: MFS transporter [Chloroflexi bacterium]|nr:MFS transporter [Chloroflexota bacterium]
MALTTGKPRLYYGWIIVVVGLVIWILSVGHYYTFGVFFKPISGDFGWNRTATSLASSITIFVSGALGVMAGALTDKYGPRIVVAAGGLLMGAGYLLLARIGLMPGLSPLLQFYVFYLIVGIGMSTCSVPLTATVARWFQEKRGRALGLMTVGGGLGQFLMPPLAGLVIARADWRWGYLVIGALMIAVILPSAYFLRRDPASKGTRPYAQPAQQPGGAEAPQSPAFTLRQATATRAFWAIFIVALLNMTTQVMVMMHLVNYATDPGKGINPTTAATFIAVIGITNVIGKLVMGPVSDRIGRKATLAIVYVLAGTTMLWLIVARDIWMFYLFAALFGFAYGGWIPMFPAMVADLFGMASLGALIGAVHVGNAVGGAIGPIIGGFIFDTTGSYVVAFILGAAIFYSAAALVLSVKPPRGTP